MKTTNGFTLIELIITISVIGIMMALAIPSLQQIIRDNRIRAVADNLQMSMLLARTEALTTYRTIYLCPKKRNDTLCETDSALQDYQQGWLLFKDCNGDGLFDLTKVCDNNQDGINDSDELLKVVQYDLNEVSITADVLHQAKVGFNSLGRSPLGEAVYTITAPATDTRIITVSRTGIISRGF